MQNIYIDFDFDGTLVDTQKYHAQIESTFLLKYGVEISPGEISQTYAGRTPRERIAELLASYNVFLTHEELEFFELHKNNQVVLLAKEWKIDLLPGVKQFIEEAKKTPGVVLWISSWTSVAALQELLPFFGLDIHFYTSADEVINKKPAPDVFDKTFDKMGAKDSDKKVVIGDWLSDIIGGKAAGAKTIFVNENPAKGSSAGAQLAVKSFEEFSMKEVYWLFAE